MRPLQLVIASGKGGVGKSTLSASMVKLFSRERSLLAIDADAEAPNLHLLLGVNQWDKEEEIKSAKIAEINYDLCTACNICVNSCQFGAIKVNPESGFPEIHKLFCEGCYTCSLVCPVKAISLVDVTGGILRYKSDLNLGAHRVSLISAENQVGRPGSGKLVYEAKTLGYKVLADLQTNFIIVDAPAGIGCQVVAALNGAQYVLIVLEPTYASINDATRLLKVVRNFRAEAFVVLNKSDLADKELRDFLDNWLRENGLELIGEIPFSDKFPKWASNAQLPVDFPEDELSKPFFEIFEKVKSRVIGDN